MTPFVAIVLTPIMSALLAQCAPNVGPKTMGGIIQYESAWHRFAIGDNDARRSYFPTTLEDARAIADRLIGEGHNLDAGYAQINSANWRIYGLNTISVFDPCTNVRVGAAIIATNYVDASKYNWVGHPLRSANDRYYQEQYALIHALSKYNSGGFWASMTYAGTVYQTALDVHLERSIDPTGFVRGTTNEPPPPGTPFAQAFQPNFGNH